METTEHSHPKHWLPPITAEKRKGHGCVICEAHGVLRTVAPPDMLIAVGFGYAGVTKDGREVWSEPSELDFDKCWTVAKAEEAAAHEPDADWRITLEAPLAGRTYQRQGENNWVLVEQNMGFA